VDDHHSLRRLSHGVEQCRLNLDLGDCRRAHGIRLGVQNGVLAGVGGQADAALARHCAQCGQLGRALVYLGMKLGQIRVAGIGRQGGRHPVHADVELLQSIKDRGQVLQRHAEMRSGLPASRVV
jgi:hypothetical protein